MNPLADIHLAMFGILVLWVGLVIFICRKTINAGSVGLPAAMALTMSFLYGGCFVYAVPGYTHTRPDGHWYLNSYNFTEWMVVQGAAASLLGLVGLALGVTLAQRRKQPVILPRQGISQIYERNMMVAFSTISLLGMLLIQLRISFPFSGAIFELSRNVLVMLICLGAYRARRDGRSMLPWLALAVVVPIYYMVSFGLASYGLMFSMTLIAFWLAMLRTARGTLKTTIMAIVIGQAMLTLFIGWMSFREEIRLVAWQGVSGSVLDLLWQAMAQTKLFSLTNFDALDIVNIRLNLPLFIGRMIEQHELFPELQLWGSTLVILPLVLLPRALWPGKPTRGGSDFMSEHTGITLSENVTFGSGTVFEFYANFGYIGVFLGFIVVGWVIRRIDMAAYASLLTGRYLDFARWYVMGLVALDPLLRPFFIVNGIVFAWILMGLLKFSLLRLGSRRRSPPRSVTAHTPPPQFKHE
ncbi:hypothetical protein TRL7639_04533 [Falsiruegeria litorea R37]|uniref:Oligosaccharide repeat unit polymerase n=1 Tax=Falsiruegeria litorea R37 TaxID=1200284 RepID=A0A1Y5TW69_9RHOB|nr:hypothetical protein [Falsiruegeria litorea]SLN74455.1 hypothetical protein TRL7639_04533 [Falsiruegeria litorea R37]